MREQFDLKYKKVLGAKQDWYNWLTMHKVVEGFLSSFVAFLNYNWLSFK